MSKPSPIHKLSDAHSPKTMCLECETDLHLVLRSRLHQIILFYTFLCVDEGIGKLLLNTLLSDSKGLKNANAKSIHQSQLWPNSIHLLSSQSTFLFFILKLSSHIFYLPSGNFPYQNSVFILYTAHCSLLHFTTFTILGDFKNREGPHYVIP